VRLLATGDISKNDPNDARSVAVAALRSADVREARRDDHAAVLKLKVWSKRYQDLGRARTQVTCRLYQVLCELVAGGAAGEITAGQAARILASITPAGAVEAARCQLAAELVEDLRGVDTRIRETRKKAAAAVRAAGTSLTGLFGVGPVVAAAVIGDVRHVSRFPNRDHFAAYNGTAPVEVSSGGRKVDRLSRRGNRRLNHATHMAAVTQIRYRHSPGRAYYDKKLAEGKTGKEALRCLKRQISDAIFACLQADARRAATRAKSPGGQPGNHFASRAAGSHPEHRLFGQATPGPATHPTTPVAPFPAPLPSRANGRPGQGPGEPGRAAAPAGRPRRGRPRADNAPRPESGHAPARTRPRAEAPICTASAPSA
jgi:transposase